MIINRTSCVLCKSSILEDFYTLKNFPILYISTTADEKDDIYIDFEYKICKVCRCVQFTSLIDPVILYSCDNKLLLTPFWNDHHTTFSNFIKESINLTTICEIGGGSNPIYPFLKNDYLRYTILDIYENNNKIDNINYQIGNCENFIDYTDESILMSHTFEHLYNPHNFLESISKTCVKNIIISIPNFNSYLKNKSSLVFINNQHTFYYDQDSITTLFGSYGFIQKKVFNFKEHSLFFYFEKSNLIIQKSIKPITVEKELFDHFNLRPLKIKQFNLNKKFYIMPSTTYGQVIYYFLNNKENVIGFIDNDPDKLNKRTYGTPLLTYLPSILSSNECNDILIIKTLYFNEMYDQIKNINKNITIHTIDI